MSRISGDEFVVALDRVQSPDVALTIAEKVRLHVARECALAGAVITPTVSIGVAVSQKGDDSPSIRARADEALFQAKLEGRNRVHLFGDPSSTTKDGIHQQD